MITFTNIKWKNLLSTGNDFTEIALNRSKSTLIVGQNGAGKSTLLDALSFALFGKPYRDIKKNQLINSINGKGTLVEVEFTVGKSEFKIVRGIKPAKFEIWQNGNQINQDSNARNFQKFLESNILGLNHKSFHQIVVLGSANFVPFMQLPTQARREIIEDLLDINIFSKMNGLLKERVAVLKEEMRDATYHYDLAKDKIKLQNDNIEYLEELAEAARKAKTEDLKEKEEKLESLQKEIEEHNEELLEEVQSKLSGLRTNKTDFDLMKRDAKKDMKGLMTQAKFFQDNDTCPTCTQSITKELKDAKLKHAKEAGLELQETVKGIEKELEKFEEEIGRLMTDEAALVAESMEISVKQRDVSRILKEIEKIRSTTHDTTALDKAVKELEALKEDRDVLFDKRQSINEKGQYYAALNEMLKDSGIKTKVIKQYLPVMNKLINNYLQVLDFFVSFHIDENFDEVIKSRHRDDFNYASFSEGEKQRIDLALLFTWRQIAKMKNSVSTNLLILDETFDSSLDADGVENLTKILSTLGSETNTFIISHKRDELEGKFRSKIEFVKEQNFSKIA